MPRQKAYQRTSTGSTSSRSRHASRYRTPLLQASTVGAPNEAQTTYLPTLSSGRISHRGYPTGKSDNASSQNSQPKQSRFESQEVQGTVLDDAATTEVIMALDMREKNTMGCAYFSTADGILHLSQDMPMSSIEFTEQFITHAQPTTILVSGRAREDLIDFLKKKSSCLDPDDSGIRFVLRALASSDFASSAAREKLGNLGPDVFTNVQATVSTVEERFDGPIEIGSSHEPQYMKLIRCGALVNLDDVVSVNCAGAILADLHRRRSIGLLPDGQSAEVVFHIRSLRTFSLADFMYVSSDTLATLQIIRSEVHPNSQAWGPDPNGTGAKESLSVYGLFHQLACTPQGRTSLRQIFLRPSLDLEIISERHRTITLLLHPENGDFRKQFISILRKVKNVRSFISQLQKGVDSLSSGRAFDRGVWATLRGFAAQALRLREIARHISGGDDIRIIRKLTAQICPTGLMMVGDLINRTIDFEQSTPRHRPSVKAGIDPDLDELKRRYDGMQSFLTKVAEHVSGTVPDWARQYILSCIFLPQLGFLMVVTPDETGHGKYQGEGGGDDQWEKLFVADGAACYKNRYMKELDDQYGDTYCEIGDREVEIMHGLAERVLEYEGTLTMASDVCGEFDALLALAHGAEKYSWVVPRMTGANTIMVHGGRHPLQELVVPSFVPNDCFLAGKQLEPLDQALDEGDCPQAVVLTGPNHSGKSIYLKQTAIIVYLAHIGSFVPAEKAVIGLTDKILTRISTKESVSRSESAFALDLEQIAHAALGATSSSLVLVDEFGKGTNADDGAGLLAALLDHFLTSTCSPRLLLATHFHELFEGSYIDKYDRLGVAHMDVLTDLGAHRVEDQVVYLFRFARGHSNSSFGAQCAALNGVPRAIVDRAEAIAQLLARNEDLSTACAKLSKEEEEQLEEAERVARRFVQTCFDYEGSAVRVGIRSQLLNMLS